jgi:DNA modification methylase
MSYYSDPLVTLLHGDCIEVMAGLEADSVDAVVTDPPYGLEFMGKGWDRLGDDAVSKSWDTKGRKENIPQVSPDDPGGRHGVHYKQINPRCRNCGRAVNGRDTAKGFKVCSCDAPDWYQPNTLMVRQQEWHYQWGREALRVTKPGGYLLAFGGTRTHHRLVCALEDAGWIIRDELDWIYASGFPKGKANLKPAHEPIVLARKPGPLRPLGIDECRIGYQSDADYQRNAAFDRVSSSTFVGEGPSPAVTRDGRWPSNVLLSDPELFDQANPYVVGSGATTQGSTGGTERTLESGRSPMVMQAPREGVRNGYPEGGGYSRFFIIPKADRAERERGLAEPIEREQNGSPVRNARCLKCGKVKFAAADRRCQCGDEAMFVASSQRANSHPTVKPIDLMRHLVRLVTPVDGVVLDPFLGSGTTCLAASEEGFRSIGIERELEYLEIAKGRLMATPMGLGLFGNEEPAA